MISYLKGTLKEEQNHTQKIDRCLDLIKVKEKKKFFKKAKLENSKQK